MFLSTNDKPADDYWSMALIKDTIAGLPETERKLIVIPGEYQEVEAVNQELNKYDKVLLVVASDEENKFNIDAVEHPDIIIYSMYPTDKFKNVDYWLPLGYTPHTRPLLENIGMQDKMLDWFFAGQASPESRLELINTLKTVPHGLMSVTEGFAQGFEKQEYMELMAGSKVAPSPEGFVPESFRMYEALEAGIVPLPQRLEHHLKLFDYLPFQVFEDDWSRIGNYIENYSQRYPKLHNKVFAWWQMQKRQIRERFKKDLGIQEEITVLVPTSPVRSNPSTAILEETIKSIRHQLPDSEIILTFDGVRIEQEKFDANYQLFVQKALWYCNYKWNNVTPMVFEEHTHQVGMAREALKYVNTPYIAYVEHDAPFTEDKIDWEGVTNNLANGTFHLVRFHFEKVIPPEHEYMMLDAEPQVINGTPFIRTAQWSQRPHVATVDFYNRILRDEFSNNALSMIEDKMHGIAYNAYNEKGKAGWNEYRLAIYAPKDHFQRSEHLDARQGAEKYDNKQVF